LLAQPLSWPKAEQASRAVREYLTALDAARSDDENGMEAAADLRANQGRARSQEG
jgi:hypothetical protein